MLRYTHGHRANILSEGHTHTGIGFALQPHGISGPVTLKNTLPIDWWCGETPTIIHGDIN